MSVAATARGRVTARTAARVQPAALTAYLGFVLIVLLVLALQAFHFSRRPNYRDDEIRTVHAGMTMSPVEVVRWMSVDIHPPLWRVSATTWVSLFGPYETITRFSSALYAALAFAVIYRLSADLFGRVVALLAAFIAGTHGLALFYTHEFRPYAALLLWTVAFQWQFLRWLRRPTFARALLYVLFAAAALYTHFFTIYALVAQVIAALVLVRWRPRWLLRAAGLVAAAGLAFAGWLPSLIHGVLVTHPGGIRYGLPAEDPATPAILYNSLQIRPLGLGTLLIGAGVLISVTAILPALRRVAVEEDAIFRHGPNWRKWYFVIFAVVVLVGAYLTDFAVGVLTQRNLIIIVPSLAILAALGLRVLPWQAWIVALALILNPAAREFINYQSPGPYREALTFIGPAYTAHEPVVISVDQGTGSYFTYAYYLMDRMPERIEQADMFYLSPGAPDINLPDPPLNHIRDDSPESLQRFERLIEGAERVWWITGTGAVDYADTYRRSLAEHGFERVRAETVDDPQYKGAVTFEEYRRER